MRVFFDSEETPAMNQSTAQQLSRRICFTLGIVLAGLFGTIAVFTPYAMARELWLIQATGYTALGALFVALLITPTLRLLRYATAINLNVVVWTAFQRSFGISAACFASVHAALTLTTYLQGSWPFILTSPYLRAGVTTLMILIVLLLTSFPKITRLLHIHLWKQLHRLSYIAALLLFQHLMQSPFASRQLVIILFVGLILFSLLRLLPIRTGN